MIPDEYLVKERFDIPGGGYVEVHDSRFLPTFIGIERKMREESEAFHRKMMDMGVKAYRCNDGWVDREKMIVSFFNNNQEKGFYWSSDEDLKEGDKIFIGNYCDGGRFARIVECVDTFAIGSDWHKQYKYEPLDEIMDGTEHPYITVNTLTRKQKILRFFGLLNDPIRTDIWE